MVTWGETVQALVALFGEHVSSWVLLVLAVVTGAAPVVDRFIVRRKRIHYRVLYNSKIGLSPVELHDGEGPPPDPQLVRVARLVDRMSMVIIRIRNTGSFDIEAKDFIEDLSFTFGKRIVWDARISEAPTETIRQRIRNNLVFFEQETKRAVAEPSLQNVRERLTQRMSNWLSSKATTTTVAEAGPQWHGVRLSKLNLERGQKFKLVVVLREPDEESSKATGNDSATSKDVDPGGDITNGRIKDEKKQRRITWQLVTTGTGLLLAGALVTTLLVGVPTAIGGTPCATGDLEIKGSSVFAPVVHNISEKYNDSCRTDIAVIPTGSLDGVRELAGTNEPDQLAVLSDGLAEDLGHGLTARPVAVVVYTMVTNEKAGVRSLTTEDLRKIYSGEYHDWQQLRGGDSLPIRIVGRGPESGSRKVFEKVFGVAEQALSSDNCDERDRQSAGIPSKTIRCERSGTPEALTEIAVTPGAIGYVDVPAATQAAGNGQSIDLVELDGRYPNEINATQGYPFHTVEYLYTRGNPPPGGLLDHFIGYLAGDAGRAELREAGYAPCIDPNLHRLCGGS